MALEREILARIQKAAETEDSDQTRLYKAFLGDLTYRKSQGLTDHPEIMQKPQFPKRLFTKYNTLPKVHDSALQGLIDKVNPVLGLMDDVVAIDDAMSSQEWGLMENTLTEAEKPLLHRAFNAVCSDLYRYGSGPEGQVTFGDARKLSYYYIRGMRMVGEKIAAVLMHSIQPRDEVLNT